MSKIIKNFSDFQKINEEGGALDFIKNLVGSGAGAFTDVLKGKAIEYLYGYFGVTEDSLFGKILTNFAETIEISELYNFIIKGDSGISVKTLAEKLTDTTMETFTEVGIDGLAERFNLTKSNIDVWRNGWIYRTLKEMISNKAKQADFRESILGFWTMVLTSIAGGGKSPLSQLGQQGQSSNNKKNPFDLTPEEEKKASTDPGLKQAANRSGMDVSSMLKGIMGGLGGSANQNGAAGTVGGQ